MTSSVDKLIALAEEHDSKATPGPWDHHVSPDERRSGIRSRDNLLLISTTGQDDLDHGNKCERKANHAFIAASRTAWPETAKALKVAREALETCSAAQPEGRQSIMPARALALVAAKAREALAEIDRIAKSVME